MIDADACEHSVVDVLGFRRSWLVLDDAAGDADHTQLYYQCSNCFAEFVITINALNMKVIEPMKETEKVIE